MIAILLLVLGVDPSIDASSSAMAAAVADGLGSRGHVELERVGGLPSDAAADQRAQSAKAEAVIEVSWPDADGRRAHLHAHLRAASAWIDRDISFDATSPSWERGRAVGLSIAAMIPDEAEPSTAVATPDTPKIVETTTPPPPPPSTAHAEEAPPALATSEATRDEGASRSPRSSGRAGRFELGVFGELAPTFHGDAAGSGGRIDGTWWLMPRWGVRAAIDARVSSIAAAGVADLRLGGGAGVAIRLLGDGTRETFVTSAVLGLARDQVSRTRNDGVVERRAHVTPTLALFGEGSFPLSSHLALVGGVGLEVAIGETKLAVNDSTSSELPRVAIVGALGLRWAF